MRSTLKDIAQKIGVSPATVSLVLNGKKGVGDEVRAKVLSVAKELNYPIPTDKRQDEFQAKTRTWGGPHWSDTNLPKLSYR